MENLPEIQNPHRFRIWNRASGHPTVNREALESIADSTFFALRGLVLQGGQVKIDTTSMPAESTGFSTDRLLSILKAAAQASLEVAPVDAENALDITIERQYLDFVLSQQSYALAVNAMAVLAIHRPVFYETTRHCA